MMTKVRELILLISDIKIENHYYARIIQNRTEKDG